MNRTENHMPIRSQATKARLYAIIMGMLISCSPRVVEGSETRGPAKAMMPPRVPGIQTCLDCEIVRSSGKPESQHKQLVKEHALRGAQCNFQLRRESRCWVDRRRGSPKRGRLQLRTTVCGCEVSGYNPACNSRTELGQWFGPFHGVSLEVHRVNCGKPKAFKVKVICSEAKGSTIGTLERSETRSMRSATDNSILERPTPYQGEEIVHALTKVWDYSKPAHGNVIAQETVNGTMHLLRVLERALFYGDSSLLSLQFDGYEKLMNDNCPATNIIDLRGLPLSEDVLTDGCMTASDAPNYGQLAPCYA